MLVLSASKPTKQHIAWNDWVRRVAQNTSSREDIGNGNQEELTSPYLGQSEFDE